MLMYPQQVGENTWRLWGMNQNGRWELIMTSWGKDAEKATKQWIEDCGGQIGLPTALPRK